MAAFVVCAANDDNSPAPIRAWPLFRLLYTSHSTATAPLPTLNHCAYWLRGQRRRRRLLLHATCSVQQRATCVYCNFIKCKIVTAKIAAAAATTAHRGSQTHTVLQLELKIITACSGPPAFVPSPFCHPTALAWLNRLQFMTGSCQLWFALWSARGCGLWSVLRVWRRCGRRLPVARLNPQHTLLHPLACCNTLASESGVSNL